MTLCVAQSSKKWFLVNKGDKVGKQIVWKSGGLAVGAQSELEPVNIKT